MSTSSTTASSGAADISALNMTGGLPTSRDLAPAIIFIILYFLAGILLVFRLSRAEDRSLLLIRPGVFWLVRFASLVLRAVMAKNVYGASELVADLVLISIGYLFLISTFIDAWKKFCDYSSPPPHPRWVQQLQRICQLVFLAAIATAIASGAMSSNVFNSQTGAVDQGVLGQVISLRHASAILALVLTAVGLVALCLTSFEFALDKRGVGFLLIPGCSLLIVAAYRVAQTFSTDPNSASRSLAAFWVLQILFEFIAFVSYLSISLPTTWFPRHADHPNAGISQAEMGQLQGSGVTAVDNERYSNNNGMGANKAAGPGGRAGNRGSVGSGVVGLISGRSRGKY